MTKGLAAMDDTKLSGKVSGGYCFGAAMCWLKITMTKETINYGSLVDHTNKAVVQRMAHGHRKHEKLQDRAALNLRDAALARSDELHTAIENRRQKESDEAFAAAKAELDEATRRWQDNYSAAANHKDFKGKMDKVTAILDETLAEEKTKIKEKLRQAQQLAQTRADNARDRVSPNVTKEEVVKETWQLLAKIEQRKYTGDLTPVKRIEPTGSTVGDFVLDVVGASCFTAGRGMIISFDTGKAPTTKESVLNPPGHAVALYRVDDTTWWLFEPNLGVFVVEGRARLIYALVLVMADGYDKRALGDDRAIVFCKTEKIFPDQGDDSVDPSLRVDRDKAKTAMKKRLEQLAANALEAGVNALRVRQGENAKDIAAANKDMQEAFLRARIGSAATKPSELLDDGSPGFAFIKRRGQIADTGMSNLYESLDAIY